jgi:hypothetical protein
MDTCEAMPNLKMRALACSAVLFASLPASGSHLVTGNGFGFAVVSPETGSVTRFYAHPYSFTRPDPKDPLSEGIETTNFIKQLSWSGAATQNPSADSDSVSHVIRIRTSSGEGTIFMPFGFLHPALILNWQPDPAADPHGGWQVEWTHPLQSQKILRIQGIAIQHISFPEFEESLLLIPLDASQPQSAQSQNLLDGSRAWALLSVDRDTDPASLARKFFRWRVGLSPQALAKRELVQLEEWRVPPDVHFTSEKERHLWRQSEVILRIAQCREPNRPSRHSNGLIVASLPDGVWFTPWVRDMAYAAAAFAQMGHQGEARAALLAYFNAQPTGKMRVQTAGADYQVSVVRYFGDGSEEPFFTMEGSTNIEFDDWGEVLWLLGEYLHKYNDPALLAAPTFRGQLYESARDFIAAPLVANFEPFGDSLIVATDTSVWEERQKDAKHFAFSTAEAIVGLRAFAGVAQRAGDEPTRTRMLAQVALLQKGFDEAFIRGGKLHGTLEEGVKNDIDGALLPVINFGVVTDPAVVRDTVKRMELLKVDSGGYRRVRSTYTDPAIFEYWYERQEFVFVDFSLAELNRRLGNRAEAAAALDRIVDKAAADHYILPEMYVSLPCRLFPGSIGDPTGALPMVGYGAGAFILHLEEREKLQNHP